VEVAKRPWQRTHRTPGRCADRVSEARGWGNGRLRIAGVGTGRPGRCAAADRFEPFWLRPDAFSCPVGIRLPRAANPTPLRRRRAPRCPVGPSRDERRGVANPDPEVPTPESRDAIPTREPRSRSQTRHATREPASTRDPHGSKMRSPPEARRSTNTSRRSRT